MEKGSAPFASVAGERCGDPSVLSLHEERHDLIGMELPLDLAAFGELDAIPLEEVRLVDAALGFGFDRRLGALAMRFICPDNDSAAILGALDLYLDFRNG